MTKRKKTKKLSRNSILSEAKRLFSKKGYRGTTIRDLTKVFGVSRPSIYYYFKSKMEILLELHAIGFEETSKDLDKLLVSDIPTKEKFKKILEIHARNIVNDVESQRIFYFDEMEMPKVLTREIRKRRRAYTDKIIKIYEQGVNEGIFKELEPKMAVYILLGACNWLTMWYTEKKDSDPERLLGDLMTILCKGYEIE
ncbi:TetR/AcrR family transcriptional regulator [Thermodesulfobacteriota bacterium]